MEFDKKRYVAPGLPRITKKFIKEQLPILERENGNAITLDEITSENPFLVDFALKWLGDIRMIRLFEDCGKDFYEMNLDEPDNDKLAEGAMGEEVVKTTGAIIYYGLKKQGLKLYKGQGLPILDDIAFPEFYDEFYSEKSEDYREGSSPGGLFEMLSREDPILSRFLSFQGEKASGFLKDDEDWKPENLMRTFTFYFQIGVRPTYDILKRQLEINRLKEAFNRG